MNSSKSTLLLQNSENSVSIVNVMLRYIIGFGVTVSLIILLIVLLFSGGGGTPSKKVPSTGKTLDSYASTSADVRLTIDGPINAVADHRQQQITVDRDNVVVSTLKGYDGEVIDTKTFANTQASYTAFLHSLELLGFAKGVTNNKALASEAGHCAQGNRYIFELQQDGNNIERYWATSCGGPHSYLGIVQNTIDLFRKQIPTGSGYTAPTYL